MERNSINKEKIGKNKMVIGLVFIIILVIIIVFGLIKIISDNNYKKMSGNNNGYQQKITNSTKNELEQKDDDKKETFLVVHKSGSSSNKNTDSVDVGKNRYDELKKVINEFPNEIKEGIIKKPDIWNTSGWKTLEEEDKYWISSMVVSFPKGEGTGYRIFATVKGTSGNKYEIFYCNETFRLRIDKPILSPEMTQNIYMGIVTNESVVSGLELTGSLNYTYNGTNRYVIHSEENPGLFVDIINKKVEQQNNSKVDNDGGTNNKNGNTSMYEAYKSIVYNCVNYCVVDINDDGVIELVALEGTCTADYKFVFYTYQNGQAIKLGENSAGSSSLYKMNDGNHLRQINIRMDYERVNDIYYIDGKLDIGETSTRELTNADYQSENFAKGDVLLKMYENNNLTPLNKYK